MDTDMIIKIIFTLGYALLIAYVIPLLKSKIGEVKYRMLIDHIEYAVRYAEQLYSPEENTEKKRDVFEYTLGKSNDLGLGLLEDDVNKLVEGVVNFVKH